ncbi:uncharacterized protein LOC120353277 [Nilaparvata lugens]|uniref:uncharacterized protein LOC120353277 n=1 Tax=Nilaparvata lugens TaxID=108931 RepID=UPI00193E778C|nr:uncharacterized protein LOC120353277 [Nilaparvata lugens]
MNVLDELSDYRHVGCEEFDECGVYADYLRENGMNALSIIHLNIRSYRKNFDDFIILLECLKHKFDIVILTETWLSLDENITHLEEYCRFRTSVKFNQNDGVLIYVRSELNASCKEINIGGVNCLDLDCYRDGQKFGVLCVYRCQGLDLSNFIGGLEDRYDDRRNSFNDTIEIIAGDINCNILLNQINNISNRYLDALYEAGFVSCVNVPTRRTAFTSTCIDHIFVKHVDVEALRPAVLRCDITDHYATSILIKNKNYSPNMRPAPLYASIDYLKLSETVSRQNWDDITTIESVNQCTESLLEKSKKYKIVVLLTNQKPLNLKK